MKNVAQPKIFDGNGESVYVWKSNQPSMSSILGVPTKNPRTNKLDSSMLKSKNQVTLFVNYSYNNFYDFLSSENK